MIIARYPNQNGKRNTHHGEFVIGFCAKRSAGAQAVHQHWSPPEAKVVEDVHEHRTKALLLLLLLCCC